MSQRLEEISDRFTQGAPQSIRDSAAQAWDPRFLDQPAAKSPKDPGQFIDCSPLSCDFHNLTVKPTSANSVLSCETPSGAGDHTITKSNANGLSDNSVISCETGKPKSGSTTDGQNIESAPASSPESAPAASPESKAAASPEAGASSPTDGQPSMDQMVQAITSALQQALQQSGGDPAKFLQFFMQDLMQALQQAEGGNSSAGSGAPAGDQGGANGSGSSDSGTSQCPPDAGNSTPDKGKGTGSGTDSPGPSTGSGGSSLTGGGRPSSSGDGTTSGGSVGQTAQQQETIASLTAESPLGPNASSPNWQSTHDANVTKAAQAAKDGSQLEFFGDSITYNMAAAGMPSFGKDFASAKPEAFGIGGDKAADLLYRINHGEFQGTPKVAVINIGTNDTPNVASGAESVQDVVNKVDKTIESIQARSPETKVLLMGLLPRQSGMEQVNEINAGLSKLANGTSVVFDNIDSQMEDKNGNLLPGITYDGLHPNNKGYQIWDNATKATITQMLESPSVPAASQGGGGSDNQPSTGTGSDGNTHNTPGTPNESTGGATTLDTAHLKGMDLSGGGWIGENTWPTPKEIEEFSQRGFNTVRLEMSWEKLQPQLGGPLDPTELSKFDALLEAGAKYGVKIIPDFHNWDRYNTNHGALGQGDITNDQSGTVVGTGNVSVADLGDAWAKLARHVDANPTLSSALGGWDLMNEPHDDGGTWASTAAAVDKAIRATGDQHTVVIEGDDWARNFNGLASIAKQDPNVAYEAHTYWNGDGSGVYNGKTAPADKNVGVEAIKSFVDFLKQNHVNGFVGEFGVPSHDTSWAPAVTNFIDYLAQNGVGNSAWAAGPAWGSYELSLEPNNGQNPPILDTIINADKQYGT